MVVVAALATALALALLVPVAAARVVAEPVAGFSVGKAVAAAINAVRRQSGLHPLRSSAALTRAAASHAASMGALGYFSHSSANGESPSRRISSYYPVDGATSWAVGEVLAWQTGDASAQALLQRWLASPPHRSELLGTRWREIGVSVVHVTSAPGAFGGRDVTIAVVDFGVRR